MTRPLIFIDGDQGTTGLLARTLLAERDDLALITLPEAERKHPGRRAEALNSCDLALLCLPDDAAREAVALVRRPGVRLIDASSAHRCSPGWVYGLPELDAGQPTRIAAAQRVSNPGCYPTGALLLLRPLVQAGLLPADHPLVVHAVSGYSGLGRAGLQAHEGGQADQAPPLQVYGLHLDHKHLPEMQLHAGLAHPPLFVPAYGHYRQGIVLTIPLLARQLPAGVDGPALHAALAAHHAGHAQVTLMPLAVGDRLATLDPRALNDSNRIRLSVFSNPDNGQLLLSAVFDNLGKGAARAALQNLDLMLGLRDTDLDVDMKAAA